MSSSPSSSCPTCASETPPDAAYCHRCGASIGAPPDRDKQLRQLELRLMEAETQRAEIEARWMRQCEEQRSEAARKTKAVRALGYNLVGIAVLMLMLGYLFAGAMWLRQAKIEGGERLAAGRFRGRLCRCDRAARCR